VVVRPDLEATLKQLGFGYRAGFITHTLARLLDRQGDSLMVDVDGGESDVDAVDRIGASIELFLTGLREREAASEAQEVEVEDEVDVSGKGGAKKCRQRVRRPPKHVDERWRAELQSFKGVGRKVADCIGLMSLDRVSWMLGFVT
jgi:endonuclease III